MIINHSRSLIFFALYCLFVVRHRVFHLHLKTSLFSLGSSGRPEFVLLIMLLRKTTDAHKQAATFNPIKANSKPFSSTFSLQQIEAFTAMCRLNLQPSPVVLRRGEAVSKQQIITVNMITIIMMVIASVSSASSSLKPCLFSDPSSQESFWSNGPFNLPFSLSPPSHSLHLCSLLLFV